jgi:glycosyltransferase involved in cell wall biosynthesis
MTAPRRVLVLNERDPLHPKAGGAEVHVAEISQRMSAMGFEITQFACSFPGAPASERVAGMRVERLGSLPLYYARVVARTARETRRGRFDVVVEHLNKVPFCARAYSAVPVVAVNHHLFGASAFLQVSWPIALVVVAIERLIPWVYRGVPFLAVSESSREDLVRRGIDAGRIDLIYNGVRFPEAEPKPLAARASRVVYLGRLEAYKRVDLLLRAAALLASRFPALEVVLVGRGAERPRLEQLAQELGLAGRVRFTGFVSDAERDELVGSARVCVCPSVKEGWGITVIEANALGTPVVATDAPGLRDAVRPGETGILVADAGPQAFAARMAEAIARVLSDDALAARLSAAARSWARRFDWDASARRMVRAVEAARGG